MVNLVENNTMRSLVIQIYVHWYILKMKRKTLKYRVCYKNVLMVNLVEKNTMRSLVIQIYIGTFLKWREAGSDDYL